MTSTNKKLKIKRRKHRIAKRRKWKNKKVV